MWREYKQIFVVLGFKEKVSICYLIISVKTHQHVLIGEKLFGQIACETERPAPLETVIKKFHSPPLVLHYVNRMQGLFARKYWRVAQPKKRSSGHPNTHISYDSDKHASIHLYEVELPPAESVADRGERGYSQQEVQAKSQHSDRVVRVSTPGRGIVKHWCSVLPDLKLTDRETVINSFCTETVKNYAKSSEFMVVYE